MVVGNRKRVRKIEKRDNREKVGTGNSWSLRNI